MILAILGYDQLTGLLIKVLSSSKRQVEFASVVLHELAGISAGFVLAFLPVRSSMCTEHRTFLNHFEAWFILKKPCL